MIYLIGIRVAQDSNLVYVEGNRKECFIEMLQSDRSGADVIVATDELGNFEKFLRFLGCDYMRVSGGPNAQFYDSLQDYEDDLERVIGYDRFLAEQAVKISKDAADFRPVEGEVEKEVTSESM